MTTSLSPPMQTLQDTMTRLEGALLAPVVSGELNAWIHNVQQAATTFATDWACYLRSVLHVEYEEIGKTDTELLSIVQQMIRVDQQLLEDLATFLEGLHALSRRAEMAERHEDKLAEERKRLEAAGLKVIVQIKKQQASAATWLAEALYRDRGVAD